ncbi:uncharacterized protein METZ01_LOCUS380729, partial [marine metagenome]
VSIYTHEVSKNKQTLGGHGSGTPSLEFDMSKRITLSFLFGNAQVVLWALLSLLILAPTSSLYAQDPDDVDDVEEFFGDDEEYEDDEYEDEEYLDDEEYEDDEYDDDEEYEDDEDEFDESEDNEVLSDEAENLGYTIDLQGGSPRFVNKNLIDWGSNVDVRGSVEFPVLMQVLGMKFRFGAEIGTFNYKHNVPPATDEYSGISAMGILAFPAGPGKIKLGTGIVGASPGFIMEATYGFRIGGVLDIRGG